jgi:hypothetical protein
MFANADIFAAWCVVCEVHTLYLGYHGYRSCLVVRVCVCVCFFFCWSEFMSEAEETVDVCVVCEVPA